ncbi:MAG TPA: hypothetical protein VJ810_00310 [Blastocatellia bacterium]|nr:hypothetical protein [Blastocatellia bacterium]
MANSEDTTIKTFEFKLRLNKSFVEACEREYEKVRPCPIKGDKLTVPGVGSCRARLSRPIEGQCKQLRITRRVDGWYALIVCEIPKPEPLPPTGQTVGVDVGISSFATPQQLLSIGLGKPEYAPVESDSVQ